MKYVSTRGGGRVYSFEEALFSGFLEDGGIIIPQEIPKISEDTLKKWSSLKFQDLALEIMMLYITPEEVNETELTGALAASNTCLERLCYVIVFIFLEIVSGAFSRFTHTDVVHLKQLKDELNILELFHGPSLAFKDLALSVVGRLYSHFLARRRRHVSVLIGQLKAIVKRSKYTAYT